MDEFVYAATLVRPTETWKDFVISCRGVTIEYNPGFVNGLALLGQRLRDEGLPDGILKIEEQRPGGLRQELPSLYRLADMPTHYDRETGTSGSAPDTATATATGDEKPKAKASSGFSMAAFRALEKLAADGSAWGTFGGWVKGHLAAHGYATAVSKTFGQVTDEGHALLANPPAAPGDAADDAEGTDEGTETASDAQAAAEAPQATTAPAPEAAEVTSASAVTAKQREAFEIILSAPEKWETVATRTRNVMIKSGWVDELDTKPVTAQLSATGVKVAISLGLRT